MALEGLDEAWGRLGGAVERRDEGIAIRAGENHALVLVEQPPRAFISEIACGKPSDRHGLTNHVLRRRGQTQLKALCLELPLVRCRFRRRVVGFLRADGMAAAPGAHVRHFSVHGKIAEARAPSRLLTGNGRHVRPERGI